MELDFLPEAAPLDPDSLAFRARADAAAAGNNLSDEASNRANLASKTDFWTSEQYQQQQHQRARGTRESPGPADSLGTALALSINANYLKFAYLVYEAVSFFLGLDFLPAVNTRLSQMKLVILQVLQVKLIFGLASGTSSSSISTRAERERTRVQSSIRQREKSSSVEKESARLAR